MERQTLTNAQTSACSVNKYRAKLLAHLLSVTLACGVIQAAPLDITGTSNKTISATTNDVLFIQTPSGAAAVVQFTSFGSSRADYRWRYRAPNSSTIQTGTGKVVESYDSTRQPDGNYRVTPKSDHDPIVHAGDLRMEWSFGSQTNGYVYVQTNRATIQVLNSSAFDKGL